MISLLCFSLAAIFNAAMDKVENEKFYSSIFKNLNERFWYKRISWKYAKMVGGYRFDAWHLFKSAMIILIAISIITYQSIIGFYDIAIYGIVWNLTFNLFYNEIL